MIVKRSLLVVLMLSALLLSGAVGPEVVSFAHTLPAPQEEDSVVGTIPYPGRLHDDAGQAVANGTYDFTFALYSAEAGGEPLWSEVQQGVMVNDGVFNVMLGSTNAIPAEVLNGSERWLAVSVRGSGEGKYTTLTPRQHLSAASPAGPVGSLATSNGGACPHSHWGETWEGDSGWLKLRSAASGNEAYLPGPLAGVYGSSDIFGGVHGQSNSNIGVLGASGGSFGVVGRSATGFGGKFYSTGNDSFDLALGGEIARINADPDNQHSRLVLSSNADVRVILDNDGGENHAFRIKNSGGADICYTDEVSGDWNCTGNKNAVVETESYGWRKLHAVESTGVWFEDFGSSSLVAGEATISFDPIFAETANLQVEYHVFVTPLCQEPVLLFVTDKSPSAFTVEGVTMNGKPAECDFDYRVAAKRLGYEEVRLEETTWQEGE